MTERRKGRRFQVDWPIRVEGIDDGGESFVETGALQNISSGGALLLVERPLETGARFDVFINLPFSGKKWMKYSASVVRVQSGASMLGAAVKFDGPKPEFAAI